MGNFLDLPYNLVFCHFGRKNHINYRGRFYTISLIDSALTKKNKKDP